MSESVSAETVEKWLKRKNNRQEGKFLLFAINIWLRTAWLLFLGSKNSPKTNKQKNKKHPILDRNLLLQFLNLDSTTLKGERG